MNDETLAYPIGAAAAETLKAGDDGGTKAKLLFSAMGLTAVFTALRDRLAILPQLFSGTIGRLPIEFYNSPMAVGIGYIIGFSSTAYWLLGAIISRWLLNLQGVAWGAFPDQAAAGSFALTAAIGLMVGSGVGIMIRFIGSFFRKKETAPNKIGEQPEFSDDQPARKRPNFGLIALLTTGVSFALSVAAGFSPAVSALLMLGVLFASAMSATITGQTGINPMELFGIIVLLAIRLFLPVSDLHAFFIAATVAIACGYAGDMLNDYKTGAMLGTNPTAQLISQLLGGLIGAVVGTFALVAIIWQYGGVGGDTGLSAAQAFSVTAMVQGIGDPLVFVLALIIGCLLYLNNVPAMIIGIGMILSLGMGIAIFCGGLISFVVSRIADKKGKTAIWQSGGNVLAAGLLGGEGITGTILAIIAMFH